MNESRKQLIKSIVNSKLSFQISPSRRIFADSAFWQGICVLPCLDKGPSRGCKVKGGREKETSMKGGQKAEVTMETQMGNTIPGLWIHKSGTNRQRPAHRIQSENRIKPQLLLGAQKHRSPGNQGTAASITWKKKKKQKRLGYLKEKKKNQETHRTWDHRGMQKNWSKDHLCRQEVDSYFLPIWKPSSNWKQGSPHPGRGGAEKQAHFKAFPWKGYHRICNPLPHLAYLITTW